MSIVSGISVLVRACFEWSSVRDVVKPLAEISNNALNDCRQVINNAKGIILDF